MGHYAIVGGAGFIGSHFVDELALNGHEITVVDNYCSGSKSRIASHLGKPYFKIANFDVENTDALVQALQGVDTVIHLASNPDIARAAVEPRIDFSQGTALTESVLEASRRSNVKSVLYASGSGVYGGSGLDPLKEESFLQPISTYGASKLAGESLLSSYSYMFGIKGLSFRFANVVGPNQTHGVGYDFIKKLKENSNRLEVLGNGTQTKSYIDVKDVVSGVLTANDKLSDGYDVFNVATLDYITVKEIAHMSIRALDLDETTVDIVYGHSDRGWKADVPKIMLDSTKLRSFGWKSKLSSSDAMLQSLESMTK